MLGQGESQEHDMTPFDFTNMGNDFQRQGAFQNAQNCYEQAVRLDPNYLPALANLATVLSLLGKLEVATTILYRVTEQAPNDPDQWLALGNVLMKRGRLVECMPALTMALNLRPENPDIHGNLAAAAYRRRDYESAQSSLEHVLSLGQNHHSVYFDLAHVKLAQGDLEAGLKLYEYRWHTLVHGPAWDHHIPEWQGEDITDKHILVHAEQGFGDMIMLSRFVSWIKAKRVTVAAPSSMVDLFETQPIGDETIDIDDLSPDSNMIYDFHTPMFSMLRWLGVTKADIDPKSYMVAPAKGPIVPKTGRCNVGICWASGNHRDKQSGWRRRVTDLKMWLFLAEIHNVQLWSLQRDTGTEEIENLGAGGLITDVMPQITSWADTAKLISQLDLVISVDTGVAHLAGALGTRCWMLSQRSPCWRWWNIGFNSGLPWYDDFSILWRSDENWLTMLSDCWEELRQGSNVPKSTCFNEEN
jgi:Tfp pilus assembly protein PilF